MSTRDPSNPDLERAIAEDPDDPARFAAYTAWLRQQGSPRGDLDDREEALLDEHAELFRAISTERGRASLDHYASEIRWRGGFLRTLRFRGPSGILAATLAHPSARLLHALAVDYLDDEDCGYTGAVAALAAGPRLEVLRVLRLGDLPEGQSALAGFDDRTAGDLGALGTACPRLETLRLLCPNFSIGHSSSLKILDARTGASPASVASIARARLPALEQLDLGFAHPGDMEEMAPSVVWSEDTLAPLLDGDATPALRILRLWPYLPDDDDGALVEAVRRSPLGRRLERVELCSMEALADDVDDGSYVL